MPLKTSRARAQIIVAMETAILSATESVDTDWSDLPMPALRLILEKLGLRDRLGACALVYLLTYFALVCRHWAEAAAVVTTVIAVDRCSHTGSLQAWLQKWGSNVSQLQLCGASAADSLVSLPCPRLQHLELQQFTLELGPNSRLLKDLQKVSK